MCDTSFDFLSYPSLESKLDEAKKTSIGMLNPTRPKAKTTLPIKNAEKAPPPVNRRKRYETAAMMPARTMPINQSRGCHKLIYFWYLRKFPAKVNDFERPDSGCCNSHLQPRDINKLPALANGPFRTRRLHLSRRSEYLLSHWLQKLLTSSLLTTRSSTSYHINLLRDTDLAKYRQGNE